MSIYVKIICGSACFTSGASLGAIKSSYEKIKEMRKIN